MSSIDWSATKLPSDLERLAHRAEEPAYGFFGPRSMTWHVGRESAVMLAGPAAILLQLAHPAVAAGVSEHSSFAQDPLGRFRRTFRIVDSILFGSVREALQAAAEARRIHARVRGVLSEDLEPHRAGEPYSANRPDLLLWVHATLVQQALASFGHFVRPLSPAERGRYYTESRTFGRLFGIPSRVLPARLEEFEDYFAKTLTGTLAVGDCGTQLSDTLFKGLPEPWALSPLCRVLAAGLLPARVRELYGIPWSRRKRRLFRQFARASRHALPLLPDRVRFGSAYLSARRRLDWRAAA